MLILSYFQSLHPLRRQVAPLPSDTASWPSVDIYIPTYNEELRIVRQTVLAAMGIDWPNDRINVYILDDGHRDEFREFAESCGAGYIARSEHTHAKAGNLNHAMTLTKGDLIAIFDCDHIAKRNFLIETVGPFMTDERLALIQTPHHFYSPDPFQRNFSHGAFVPPEGNLFYGLIQDGNDFWNATFFCGSCAVIRRSALQEIGGGRDRDGDGRHAYRAETAAEGMVYRLSRKTIGCWAGNRAPYSACGPAHALGSRHVADISSR
ncbi:glycosyltransferase [Asaia siamensis]|nr:glycosyltransferase [Asaia siamensis]